MQEIPEKYKLNQENLVEAFLAYSTATTLGHLDYLAEGFSRNILEQLEEHSDAEYRLGSHKIWVSTHWPMSLSDPLPQYVLRYDIYNDTASQKLKNAIENAWQEAGFPVYKI